MKFGSDCRLVLICEKEEEQLIVCYDMKHAKRGWAIVIFNDNFHPSLHLSSRKGLERDIEQIKEVFGRQLGFDVAVFQDLSARDMFGIMLKGI